MAHFAIASLSSITTFKSSRSSLPFIVKLKYTSVLVPLILLCTATTSVAQAPGAGVPRLSTISSVGAFDSINLADLNVIVQVPVRQKSGVQLPFTYTLTNNYGLYPGQPTGVGRWQLGPQMKRSVTTAMGLMLTLAVAGCSGPKRRQGR